VFKSVFSGLVAAGLVVSGLAVSAPTATAAGTCSLYVPSRVSMGQPYRGITVRLGPNCAAAGVVWADWDGYHPTQGLEEILLFDHTSSETWNLYDWQPIGRWQWRPDGAWDSNYTDVYQYGPYYTDIRLASYGRVTATRYGSKINVRTSAARYWQGGSKFIGWSGARGQIQWRTPGTTTWHGLKEVYSSSSGTYSYTYTTSAVRDYRVVLYNATNNTIWGSTSPVVRR
jgi:hypothetical protein